MHIEKLLKIMESLRNPESGCPWDLEQNYKTLLPYTIEEVYEVADAIVRDEDSDLCEELGDLLFQILFYAQIAKEEGRFDFHDIVHNLCEKLIRRHPHVFDKSVSSSKKKTLEELHKQWQTIKEKENKEKGKKNKEAYLESVKRSFPGFLEAKALQDKVAKIGFDWDEIRLVLEKIDEEQDELLEALQMHDQEKIEEEFGDWLFTIVNLARHLNLDPEYCLKRANNKFRKRFSYIENQLIQKGKSLGQAQTQEMEKLWQEAKRMKKDLKNKI